MKSILKTPCKAETDWPPSSPSGGVKVMSIQGRLNRERERLAGCGMSDDERAWRAQWIRDQRLSSNEPKKVPQMYKELRNPIRRLYRLPMDKFEKFLIPKMGEDYASLSRSIIGKFGLMIAGIYAAAYYFKYNANDWTRKGGWRVVPNRRSVLPGDPGWPYEPQKTVGADYADRGFKNSPIQKSLSKTMAVLDVKNSQTADAVEELVATASEDKLERVNLIDESLENTVKVEV